MLLVRLRCPAVPAVQLPAVPEFGCQKGHGREAAQPERAEGPSFSGSKAQADSGPLPADHSLPDTRSCSSSSASSSSLPASTGWSASSTSSTLASNTTCRTGLLSRWGCGCRCLLCRVVLDRADEHMWRLSGTGTLCEHLPEKLPSRRSAMWRWACTAGGTCPHLHTEARACAHAHAHAHPQAHTRRPVPPEQPAAALCSRPWASARTHTHVHVLLFTGCTDVEQLQIRCRA